MGLSTGFLHRLHLSSFPDTSVSSLLSFFHWTAQVRLTDSSKDVPYFSDYKAHRNIRRCIIERVYFHTSGALSETKQSDISDFIQLIHSSSQCCSVVTHKVQRSPSGIQRLPRSSHFNFEPPGDAIIERLVIWLIHPQ